MCTLPLLAAGENIGSLFVVPKVAASIDLVVHISVEQDGVRRVREIIALPGRVEHDVVEVEPVFRWRGDGLARADGYPPHTERFEQAGYSLTQLLREWPEEAAWWVPSLG
jgi:pilus assembly protein CpaF